MRVRRALLAVELHQPLQFIGVVGVPGDVGVFVIKVILRRFPRRIYRFYWACLLFGL